MEIPVTNAEHLINKQRLDVPDYKALIGKTVYYSRKTFGPHIVVDVISEEEIVLQTEWLGKNRTFTTNPFMIIIENGHSWVDYSNFADINVHG